MKILCLTFYALIIVSFCSAQYDHNIQFVSGSPPNITNSVIEIDSIYFSLDGIPTLHLVLLEGSPGQYALDNIEQGYFSGDPWECEDIPANIGDPCDDEIEITLDDIINPRLRV